MQQIQRKSNPWNQRNLWQSRKPFQIIVQRQRVPDMKARYANPTATTKICGFQSYTVPRLNPFHPISQNLCGFKPKNRLASQSCSCDCLNTSGLQRGQLHKTCANQLTDPNFEFQQECTTLRNFGRLVYFAVLFSIRVSLNLGYFRTQISNFGNFHGANTKNSRCKRFKSSSSR